MFLNLTIEQWVNLGISALIVVLTVLLGRLAISLIVNRLVRRLVENTSTQLDDFLLDAVRPPLYVLAIVLALEIATLRLDIWPETWRAGFDNLFFVLYFLGEFALAWRVLSSLFSWYSQQISARTETKMDDYLMPFLRRVALMIIGIIGLIILLDHFGIEASGLVTTLGIGSLAIALAAQEALSDTISGFIIMIDRPFRIGDRVDVKDIQAWGDVVDIGLRSTQIRTRDNRMVIVPNSVIAKSLVVNYSYPDTQYRIQIHIGIAHGSDIEIARETMIDAVRGAEGVLLDHKVEALFLEFGDSALIFRVRWWIDSYIDTRRMFDRVNTAIYNALHQAEIDIPFSQHDVHHKIDPQSMAELKQLLNGDKT